MRSNGTRPMRVAGQTNMNQGGDAQEAKREPQQHEGAQDKPLLLSVPEAADLLGIGATFAWELVHSGAIPSIRLGRRVLIPRNVLEQLIDTDWMNHSQLA